MDLLACLAIDLQWTRMRHPALLHASFAEAAAAAPARRHEILAELAVDFSPYLSVLRLKRQFPDYDYSSGDELRNFIVERTSGEEHYTPHWLYDDRFYRSGVPDIDAAIRRGLEPFGYFHFLLHGMHERRRPHRLFDADWYLKIRGNIGTTPVFSDFVLYGIFEDLSPSALFDPEFYCSSYPDVRAEILRGVYSCSLEHFVTEGDQHGLVPSADWDDDYYLSHNPDVADGVAAGSFHSPFAY